MNEIKPTKIIYRKNSQAEKRQILNEESKEDMEIESNPEKEKSIKNLKKRDPAENQYEISLKHFKTPDNSLHSYEDHRELDYVEDKDLVTSESDIELMKDFFSDEEDD